MVLQACHEKAHSVTILANVDDVASKIIYCEYSAIWPNPEDNRIPLGVITCIHDDITLYFNVCNHLENKILLK